MKVRTTEQIVDECACWCRQVPSEVWLFGRPEEMLTTSCGQESDLKTKCIHRSWNGVNLHPDQVQRKDRQVSSSVEVKKKKIERFEAEVT